MPAAAISANMSPMYCPAFLIDCNIVAALKTLPSHRLCLILPQQASLLQHSLGLDASGYWANGAREQDLTPVPPR